MRRIGAQGIAMHKPYVAVVKVTRILDNGLTQFDRLTVGNYRTPQGARNAGIEHARSLNRKEFAPFPNVVALGDWGRAY